MVARSPDIFNHSLIQNSLIKQKGDANFTSPFC